MNPGTWKNHLIEQPVSLQPLVFVQIYRSKKIMRPTIRGGFDKPFQKRMAQRCADERALIGSRIFVNPAMSL